MDITTLFKACVKTVRTRNKSLGVKENKTDILKHSRDAKLAKAKEIMRQLVSLYDFLNENRKAYMFNNSMSDVDRKTIDSTVQKVLNSCSESIQSLKTEDMRRTSAQYSEHYKNVIEIVHSYLKQVGKFYAEQKAIRVKRALDNRKIGKLEMDMKTVKKTEMTTEPSIPVIPDHSVPIDPSDQLSAEEMQMFESENELLFNELNSTSEEVRQIESKVVHIAELQELFTEKVLQQEKDIERIATTVVGGTENIRDANEQIRQAIRRNAGLRVWVLFFLLVMSFSLLFLDWYNE